MSVDRNYQASFNENNQEFVIAGKLRPRSEAEIKPLAEALDAALGKVRGTFYLNGLNRVTDQITDPCNSNAGSAIQVRTGRSFTGLCHGSLGDALRERS